MRNLLILLTFLIPAMLGAADHNVPAVAPAYPGWTLDAAEAYCDSAAIRPPEGIYFWPEKGATVLVRTSRQKHNIPEEYEIICIEASDILLPPGLVLGYIFPSASAADFHAYIYDDIDADKAGKPRHKAAVYDRALQAIRFSSRKIHVSFNPLALIPRMRSFIRISRDDPTADIPDGLRRIYPEPPASLTSHQLLYPRYL